MKKIILLLSLIITFSSFGQDAKIRKINGFDISRDTSNYESVREIELYGSRIKAINGTDFPSTQSTVDFKTRVTVALGQTENLNAVNDALNRLQGDESFIMIPSGFDDGVLFNQIPGTVGSELVINGTFDTDTDWAKDTGWTISTNKATCDGTQGALLIQAENYNDDKIYLVTYEIVDYVSGSVRVLLYADSKVGIGSTRLANGVYSEEITINTPTGSNTDVTVIQSISSFNSSIDNISVKEITSSANDFAVVAGNIGTRVNENGIIVNRTNNEARIDFSDNVFTELEPESINLLTKSQEFDDVIWIGSNTTETPNTVIAPDGTLTGYSFIGLNTTGFAQISQILSLSGELTYSFHVKKLDLDEVWLYAVGTDIGGAGKININYKFTFSTELLTKHGSEGDATDLHIESLPNGWYKIGITFSCTTLTDVRIYQSFGTSSSLGTYIWGAQLSPTNQLTRYVKTTTEPDGITPTYSRIGVGSLLLEPESENSLLRSQEIDNSSWVKSGGLGLIVGANQGIAPDGNLTADKLIANVGSGSVLVRQNNSSLLGSDSFIASVYVKANGFDNIRLSITNNTQTNNAKQYFNISNGTIGNSSDTGVTNPLSFIEDLGNGWFRCGVSAEFGVEGGMQLVLDLTDVSSSSVVGDGIKGVLMWGAQLEKLSYPTSYIKTQGSTVTRLKDQITGGGSVNNFNSEEGVLFVEMSAFSNTGYPRVISLSDGTADNRILIRYTATANRIEAQLRALSVTESSFISDSNIITDFFKIAFSWKINEFKMFINGAQIGATDTSGNVPLSSVINRLNFNDGSGNYLEGNVRLVKVFNTALTDQELKKLTCPDGTICLYIPFMLIAFKRKNKIEYKNAA